MKELFGATRPREFVAFLSLKMRTAEGPAYLFFAVDAFTQFAFRLGVERDNNLETVLKNVYELTENQDFKRFGDQEFTLVLEDYEEYTERIQRILTSVNGKVIVDPLLNHAITLELLNSLVQFMDEPEKYNR